MSRGVNAGRLIYFKDSSTATATLTVIPTMGERSDRRLWRKKGGERVAAVDKIEDKRKPEDFIGHRNRESNALHCDSNLQPVLAGCNLTMVGKISRLIRAGI